jgi:hypothetical protein
MATPDGGVVFRCFLRDWPVLWVVGFEEHFKLNAVGILERQHRTVFALGDRRVVHAEFLDRVSHSSRPARVSTLNPI